MIRLLPIILLFVSCTTLGPGNFRSSHSTDLQMRNIRRIAIYPLDASAIPEKPKLPSAPAIAGGGKEEKPVGPMLSEHLYAAMAAMPNWQIVSDREVKEVEPMVPRGAPDEQARRLGQLVYADAVISGRLVRYQEREGEAFGAKAPASVSFILDLWDVKRGDRIWSGTFDETQKPLSANILGIGEFAQRGAKFLTAEDLATDGIKKAVTQLYQALYARPG